MATLARDRKSVNLSLAELRYVYKALTGRKIDTHAGDSNAAAAWLFKEFGAVKIAEAAEPFDVRKYIDTREYDI